MSKNSFLVSLLFFSCVFFGYAQNTTDTTTDDQTSTPANNLKTTTIPGVGTAAKTANQLKDAALANTGNLTSVKRSIEDEDPVKLLNLDEPSSVEKLYRTMGLGNNVQLAQYGYLNIVGNGLYALAAGHVPEPYYLGPGDELAVMVWGDPVDLGEVKAQYIAPVLGNGSFFYPTVGSVAVSGLTRGDAERILTQGMQKKYKRFELKVTVQKLRAFPVMVVGNVVRPGLVTADVAMSMFDLLSRAGGVLKNGTLRNIQVTKKDGSEKFIDLYQLLLKGKNLDYVPQEGDVVLVGDIGSVVGVTGEVKRPGIYELKGESNLAQVLELAGGVLPTGENTPVYLVKYVAQKQEAKSGYLTDTAFASQVPQNGNLLFIDSISGTKQYGDQSSGFIEVAGSVNKPGYYPWKPGMTLADAALLAGGIEKNTYLPATKLLRKEAADAQRVQLQKIIDENKATIQLLQNKILAAKASSDTTQNQQLLAWSQELDSRSKLNVALISQLQGEMGRVYIEMNQDQGLDKSLGANTKLVSGDQVVFSLTPAVVNVFGEVYNQGSVNFVPGQSVDSVVKNFGGMKKTGDLNQLYIIKASGRVMTAASRGQFLWWNFIMNDAVEPGDSIIIPSQEAADTSTLLLTQSILSILSSTSTVAVNSVIVWSYLK